MGSLFTREPELTREPEPTQETEPTARVADYDVLLKLVITGDFGVGKSTLLSCFVDGTFNEIPHFYVGIDFKVTRKIVGGRDCKLQIWDPTNDHRFRTTIFGHIPLRSYRGAHGFVMLYDVTNRQSFDNIKRWNQNIEKYGQEGVPRMIVGTKSDLDEQRVVSTNEGQSLADEISQECNLNISFIEVSSKSGEGVDQVFEDLTFQILQKKMLVVPTIKGATRR